MPRVFYQGKLLIRSVSVSGATINNSDVANKFYVDGTIDGIKWKESVRVATTIEITLSGIQTVDGILLGADDRILVKDQITNDYENGIYLVKTGSWIRSSDSNTSTELVSACTMVEEGTTNADQKFVCTNNEGFTLDVDTVTFIPYLSATAHNSTTGIQGGATNQYYHLTSSEHTELTEWIDDVTLSDGGAVDTGAGQITTPQINFGYGANVHQTYTYLFCDGGNGLFLRPFTGTSTNQASLHGNKFSIYNSSGIMFLSVDQSTEVLKVDTIGEYSSGNGVVIDGLRIKDANIASDDLTVQNNSAGNTIFKVSSNSTGDAQIQLTSSGTTNETSIIFDHSGSSRYYIGITEATNKLVIYNHNLSANSFELTTNGEIYMDHAKDDAVGDTACYINSTTGQFGIQSSILSSKTNINTINDASWIYNLVPKTFNYRNTIGKFKWGSTPVGDTRYGLIADDVETVNSDVCSYRDIKNHIDGCPDSVKNMPYECNCSCPVRKTLISLKYNDLISPMIKCIKDHKTAIDDIKNDNNIITDHTTSRTLSLSDSKKYIRFTSNNPITIYIPCDSIVSFSIGVEIYIKKIGSGSITVSGNGVTINAVVNPIIAINAFTVLKKVDTNTWDMN
jgi:hypothetical protein